MYMASNYKLVNTQTAELDGYTFEPFQDDPQSFKALKLSKILIKVRVQSMVVLN